MEMTKKLYNKLFYETLRIRMIEEEIIKIYPSDKIQSPVHLSIGQEAIAVGICSNMKKGDLIFSSYRGHAYYLAVGGSLKKFFCELFGKSNGISGGKAGSMHLSCKEKGMMGSSAIVASTIPHAVGSALSFKINRKKNITISIFGDGATEEGCYHESLNFASLNSLPILFVNENNELSIYTKISERQSYDNKKHVEAYGIKYFYIKEGYDFIKIYKICRKIIEYIKKNNKPAYLEIKCARYIEHVGINEDNSYDLIDKKFLISWKKKDPLITNKKLAQQQSLRIYKEIKKSIDFAEKSKYPDLIDIYKNVI